MLDEWLKFMVKYCYKDIPGHCFCFQDDQLLKLISCIDLTSLNSDDTDNVIERLIDKAILPYSAVR